MVALSSMASFLGSNVIKPNNVAADTAAISTPQVFQECAQTAFSNIDGQTENDIVATDLRVQTSPISVTGNGYVKVRLNLSQESPIAPGGDSPPACDGSLKVKDTLQLKAGTFNETSSGSAEIIIDDGLSTFSKRLLSSFSYKQACRIARQQHKSGPTLSIHKALTYTEPGYPSAKRSFTDRSSTEHLGCSTTNIRQTTIS